jgi:hypothetical protein
LEQTVDVVLLRMVAPHKKDRTQQQDRAAKELINSMRRFVHRYCKNRTKLKIFLIAPVFKLV